MDRGRHARVTHPSPGHCGRPLVALLLLGGLAIVLMALGPAATAGPRSIIWDDVATPSWWAALAGVGGGGDGASDVALLKGDVTLVAGTLTTATGGDLSLTKYVGSVKRWTKTWDSPAHFEDEAEKMALSPDGRAAYITGTSVNASANNDIVVIKRSTKTGKLLWAKTYDGPAHKNDRSIAVGVDDSGNVTVVGESENATDRDVVAVSWSASGAKRWLWRYDAGGHGSDFGRDVVVAGDGAVYVAGMGYVAGGMQAAIVARLSKTGKKMWVKKYSGPDGLGAAALGLVARPGGGVYACGYTIAAATSIDGLVLGYAAGGARKVFALDSGSGGGSAQVFYDLAVTSTRSVVAVGYTETAGIQNCRFDIYRPDGTVYGAVTRTGVWSDAFHAVAADAFGGFYMTGTIHVAAAEAKIATFRGSMLLGGGGWRSLWGPVVPATYIGPAAVAVRGTTACVVGWYQSGAATGIDQVVLTYTY